MLVILVGVVLGLALAAYVYKTKFAQSGAEEFVVYQPPLAAPKESSTVPEVPQPPADTQIQASIAHSMTPTALRATPSDIENAKEVQEKVEGRSKLGDISEAPSTAGQGAEGNVGQPPSTLTPLAESKPGQESDGDSKEKESTGKESKKKHRHKHKKEKSKSKKKSRSIKKSVKNGPLAAGQ